MLITYWFPRLGKDLQPGHVSAAADKFGADYTALRRVYHEEYTQKSLNELAEFIKTTPDGFHTADAWNEAGEFYLGKPRELKMDAVWAIARFAESIEWSIHKGFLAFTRKDVKGDERWALVLSLSYLRLFVEPEMMREYHERTGKTPSEWGDIDMGIEPWERYWEQVKMPDSDPKSRVHLDGT